MYYVRAENLYGDKFYARIDRNIPTLIRASMETSFRTKLTLEQAEEIKKYFASQGHLTNVEIVKARGK